MSIKLPVASIHPIKDIEEGNNNVNNETLIIQNSHTQPVVYERLIVETKPIFNETCLIKFIVILIPLIGLIPFIVCDLYFALNDITCQHEKGNNIKINLSQWLIVSSFFQISTLCIIFYIVNSADNITNKPEKNIKYYIKYYYTFGQLFVFSWLVTGSILFSREILPNGNCNKSITSYITAKLILGFIGQLFGLYERYISKNQE